MATVLRIGASRRGATMSSRSSRRPASGECAETVLQSGPQLRPLSREDREEDRVAEVALVLHPHMAAQDAVLPGAEFRYGGTRAGVVAVGLEEDAVVAGLEGIAQQQKLGFRIDGRTLGLADIPGGAD